MFAYASYRGHPEYSNALVRQRLVSFMGTAGERVIVLAAPSGCGKTITASQYAKCQGKPVVWLSLGGQAPELSGLLQTMLVTLGTSHPDQPGAPVPVGELLRQVRLAVSTDFPDGLLIVLDDVGGTAAAEVREVVGTFASQARHCRAHVVVTSRSWPNGQPECMILNRDLLAFTVAESLEVALLFGRADLAAGEVRELSLACSGHPALTSTLLASGGAHPTAKASPSAIRAAVLALAEQHLDGEEARLLGALMLLRRTTLKDVVALGFVDAELRARGIASVIPLVSIEHSKTSNSVLLIAHDLVCAEVAELEAKRILELDLSPSSAMSVLARNGEAHRLARLLKCEDAVNEASDWLHSNTEIALSCLGHRAMLDVLTALPLNRLVGSARLMLLWTRVLYELGALEETVAKARVACQLADYDGDLECLGQAGAMLVRSLALASKSAEAHEYGRWLVDRLKPMRDRAIQCEAIAAAAVAAVICGETRAFRDYSRLVEAMPAGDSRVAAALRKLETTQATVVGYTHGDWKQVSVRLLSLTGRDSEDELVPRITRRGNAACALLEYGRLARAGSILDSILGMGSDYADSSYLALRGYMWVLQGEYRDGIACIREGIRLSLSCGDEADLALDRIYMAMSLRADGQYEESLEASERAHEALARSDFMGLRRLSAIEVSSSLLAMDDVAGSRAWLEPLLDVGFGQNTYQSLRSELVRAECDRRDGCLEDAVIRLRRFSDHVAGGNSNSQAAMYVRTFPHLLGMLAMAAGAKNLPSHMLRMVLPENVERSLRLAQSFMDRDEWMILGRRALGEERFAEYLERKGRPLCRVRMFGGLEVSTDERVIRERDWAKRKARAMFAMLVLLRGQEVSRDLILDQLWPDMDPPRAKNNFYVAWSAMKSALVPPEQRDNPCPYVESSRGRCRMVRDWVRSDVDDFEDLVAKARAAEAEGKTHEALSAYSELAGVYRGDLLPGDLYDDWFGPYRDKYRFDFIDAMVRATELLLELDDPWEAQIYVRRAVGIDPFREDLYQLALRCHISAGQRSAAIETFIQCKAQLADELGLDPSASTLALYQQVLAMEERPRTEGYGVAGLVSEYLID